MMKLPFFAFTLALLLTVSSAFAQEGGVSIKVTTTLHTDGSRTDMQTDLDARTAESKTYNPAKKLVQRETYTLDEQGRLEEGVIYDAKDKVITRVSYKYDAMGHVSDQFEKTPNGALLRRLVYRYDSNGRPIGIDVYDGAGNQLQPNSASSSRKKSRSK